MKRLRRPILPKGQRGADLFFLAPLIVPCSKPPRLYVYAATGWRVQMPLGGQQRVIESGIVDDEIACRFADMAVLRFRKYNSNLKFNYSEAQAIADTANKEPNGGMLANFLLVRLENYYKAFKDVLVLNDPRTISAPAKHGPSKFEQRIAALEQRIAELERLNINKRLEAIEHNRQTPH